MTFELFILETWETNDCIKGIVLLILCVLFSFTAYGFEKDVILKENERDKIKDEINNLKFQQFMSAFKTDLDKNNNRVMSKLDTLTTTIKTISGTKQDTVIQVIVDKGDEQCIDKI